MGKTTTPRARTRAVGASAQTLRHLARLMEAAAGGDRQSSEDLMLFYHGGILGITLDAYTEEALGLTVYLEQMKGE